MCTVTFIPVKEDEYIFTHNRDEKLTRKSSLPPKERCFGDKKLIYPVDSDKNGTWFCCDKSNKVACILNGAFEKHKSNPPYKKSRGVIVLESFLNNSFENWIEDVNLKKAEAILQKHKIEKLPVVDKENNLVGLITFKDIIKVKQHTNSCKDEFGRLRVAEAVGVAKDTF